MFSVELSVFLRTPSSQFRLKYIEVIQRHHKRTPYNTNTFFKEVFRWTVRTQNQSIMEKVLLALLAWLATQPLFSGLRILTQTTLLPALLDRDSLVASKFSNCVDENHFKFQSRSCAFPQITAEGIDDSFTHGSDIRSGYASRLGLSTKIDTTTFKVRVTDNQITSQVAGGLLRGLFPNSSQIAALIQINDAFDSLQPTYSCSSASSLFTQYTTDSSNWTEHLTDAQSLYASLDKVSGIATHDSAGWHTSFDQ